MYGVKCNVRAPHRFMRFGALCWVHLTNPGGGNDRIQVVGLSRGGREVTTYIDTRDLHNFRPGWIPDDPPFPQSNRFPWDTREAAQAWCDAVNASYAGDPVRPHAASFGLKQPPSQ